MIKIDHCILTKNCHRLSPDANCVSVSKTMSLFLIISSDVISIACFLNNLVLRSVTVRESVETEAQLSKLLSWNDVYVIFLIQ